MEQTKGLAIKAAQVLFQQYDQISLKYQWHSTNWTVVEVLPNLSTLLPRFNLDTEQEKYWARGNVVAKGLTEKQLVQFLRVANVANSLSIAGGTCCLILEHWAFEKAPGKRINIRVVLFRTVRQVEEKLRSAG